MKNYSESNQPNKLKEKFEQKLCCEVIDHFLNLKYVTSHST